MKFQGLVAFAFIGLLAMPALAQQPTPCTYGGSRMSIGGVSIESMRCEIEILKAQRNNATDSLTELQSAFLLSKSDETGLQGQLLAMKAWLDVAWPAYAKTFPEKKE